MSRRNKRFSGPGVAPARRCGGRAPYALARKLREFPLSVCFFFFLINFNIRVIF